MSGSRSIRYRRSGVWRAIRSADLYIRCQLGWGTRCKRESGRKTRDKRPLSQGPNDELQRVGGSKNTFSPSLTRHVMMLRPKTIRFSTLR